MTHSDERDPELEEISKRATEQALHDYPRAEMSLAVRIGLLLAGLLVAANSVVGVYNSLVLRNEVTCSRHLSDALNQTTDQSRDINKQAIDTALGGGITSKAQAIAFKKKYDKAYADNSVRRAAILSTTCH